MSDTNCAIEDSITTTSPRRRNDWRLLLIVTLAIAAISWVGYLETRAWNKATQLARSLKTPTPKQNLGFALRETLSRLQSALFRYQLSGNASDQDAFRAETRAFAQTILEGRTSADSSITLLFKRIEAEFQHFLSHAESLEPVKGIRRDTPETIAAALDHELTSLRNTIAELLDIEEKHRFEQHGQILSTIAQLKSVLLVSVLALGALLASLVLLMYRGALVPLQRKLSQTEAARERQERLASLGVLATGVAHEIRNPLTAIKFRLFSLKNSYGTGLAGHEDFRTIHDEIDRLEKIVRSFLEFARPAEPNFAAVSSSVILDDLQRLLGPEMSTRKVKLQVEADQAVTLRADKQQLEQVLINLVQNAADSMPEGGTISIRARQGMALLSQESEKVVLLEVTDTGPGIPLEIQERLFDPFFSTKEGGTGLGLAIATRILERHGGLMQFSTRKGHGSTFTVVLPAVSNHGENQNTSD